MDPATRAEKIIDETYSRYRTIFENTGTATILIEADMTISMVNSELARISGIPKEQVENRMKFPELIAPEDREKVMKNHALRRIHPEKAPRNYPCRVRVAGGEIKECILTVALIKGTRQSVASITDISKQRQLEREIARISEEERQQMGQVLHDDLGSHLAGVEAMSALLAGRLGRQGHPDAELAGEIKALVHQAIAKTRAMVRGLLPVHLEKGGFLSAFRRYCREVEMAFGVEVVIQGEDRVTATNITAVTHIYYIIRESVNNAAKHGKASRIDIIFTDLPDEVRVEVRDDGDGLDDGDPQKQGMGMVIMQHRADLVGAELTITGNDAGGTTVRCRIEKRYLL